MFKQKTPREKLLLKIVFTSVIALIMLIPLAMIRSQITSRSLYHEESISDITSSWGGSQTIGSPFLEYTFPKEKISYLETQGGKPSDRKVEIVKTDGKIIPDSLHFQANTTSEVLHRSIFKVPVYTASIHIEGNFVPDMDFHSAEKAQLRLGISDLKGIQGAPLLKIGDRTYQFRSYEGDIAAELDLSSLPAEKESIRFTVELELRGSRSLFFDPKASITEAEMTSDYPDPSFSGEFIPVERDIREDGFSAKWVVSQINCDSLSDTAFGVNLIENVTQYRQTERAIKYGLLVILLIFIAGIIVEIVSKTPINLIQYLVIGASLVLFYSLLLALSEFMGFGLAYLIASVLTTGALTYYFRGIVKNRWGYLLGGLVGLCYAIIYILLGMETFAFLTGTMLLFIILLVIMALTRKINFGDTQ